MTWSYNRMYGMTLAVGFTYTFLFTLADDYFLNYTVSRLDGFFPDGTFNETTRLLRMSRGVGTLTLTFSIAQDGIDEDPEDFLLFLEGARRVFVLCPVGRVTIIDRQRKEFYRQLMHVCSMDL